MRVYYMVMAMRSHGWEQLRGVKLHETRAAAEESAQIWRQFTPGTTIKVWEIHDAH